MEVSPRVIAGPQGWRIVFATTQEQVGLWRLPLDLDAAQVSGEPAKLLGGAIGRTTPSLSSSGSRLVHVSREFDGFAVRSRDLATGAETTLVRSQTDLRARISPDGGAVAYNPSLFEPNETVIYLVASSWRRLPLSFAILAG